MKDGKKPLDIQISKISNLGRVNLVFTEEMDFPQDLQELINNNQGQDDSVMEIQMIDPGDEVNSNFLSWSFESFDS